MRLATVRVNGGTRAVRLDSDVAVELGPDSVDILLTDPGWRPRAAAAAGPEHALGELRYAPPVINPEKIFCVGLNYRTHILEMGRELPAYPTVFAKYARTLVGAFDDIALPPESGAMDWEAELGVVVGAPLRRATPAQAADAVAGYCVINDVTARDYQYRTGEWLQGKIWEATTPVGPWLVTADEAAAAGRITCTVDGDLVQDADTGDLVFAPADLLAYLSAIITLCPGDLVATGTPGGVGHARTPPRYLHDGSVVVTAVEGVGECRNVCRRAA